MVISHLAGLLYCCVGAGTADVAVLAAARDDWLERSQWFCHYEAVRANAASLDAALAGNWLKGTVEGRATGLHVKRGRAIRCTQAFEGGAVQVAPNEVRNISCDESISNDVGLEYLPQQTGIGAQTMIEFRNSSVQGRQPFNLIGVSDTLSPVQFFGASAANPIRAFDRPNGRPDLADVREVDSEHLEVHLMHRVGDVEQHARIRFWMEPSPPVIDAAEIVDLVGGERQAGTAWGMYEFVDAGGVMVPRIVRAAVRNVNTETSWNVHQWRSKDLGERLPTDDDFAVKIPAGVRVRGLLKPPPQEEEKTLNVLKIAVADITSSVAIPEPTGQRWKLWLAGTVAGLVVLLLVWQLRRWQVSR